MKRKKVTALGIKQDRGASGKKFRNEGKKIGRND